MVKVKKIGVLSLGKIFGIFSAIMGLFSGAMMNLVFLISPVFSSIGSGMFGALFGTGAIIFLPIFYGLMGFVSGSIIALLYNLVASLVGGLEVETE